MGKYVHCLYAEIYFVKIPKYVKFAKFRPSGSVSKPCTLNAVYVNHKINVDIVLKRLKHLGGTSNVAELIVHRIFEYLIFHGISEILFHRRDIGLLCLFLYKIVGLCSIVRHFIAYLFRE